MKFRDMKYGDRGHAHGGGQVHRAGIAGYKKTAMGNHSGKNSYRRLNHHGNLRLQAGLEETEQISFFRAYKDNDFNSLTAEGSDQS